MSATLTRGSGDRDATTVDITVVVHPVDVKAHPSYPPGWRWAVQCGGIPPRDMTGCAQAGHAATMDEAMLAGESHGAAATRAARILGVPARYSVHRMDWDPVPAEADDLPLTKFAVGGV